MKNLINRLKKRGWSTNEIEKAVNIMVFAKKNKNSGARFLEKRMYWILLFVIIAANFSVSITMIPIFMTLNGILLYLVLITLGIVFGFSFELVIRSIEHLVQKHHVVLGILITLIALINIFLISRISNQFKLNLNLSNPNSSLLLALVYAASFALPYIISRFVIKKGYYARA